MSTSSNDDPSKHPIIDTDWNPLATRSVTVWLLGVYVALFLIRPWEILIPWLAAFSPERVTIGLAVLFAVAENRLALRLPPATVAALLFLAALALISLAGHNPSTSLAEWYKYFTLMVFHLLVVFTVRSRKELCFLILVYLIASYAYFAKAEWEYYVHGRYSFRQGVKRMGGLETTFSTANMFAAAAAVSLPFWFFLVKHQRSIFAYASHSVRKMMPLALYSYLPVALVAIYESKSRTGAVVTLAAACLMVTQLPNRSARLISVLTILVLLTLAPFMIEERNINRIRSIWDPAASTEIARESAMSRIEGFEVSFEMFMRYPFTGVGLGNFISVRLAEVDGEEANPHNLIGLLLSETGLIGLITFAILVLTTLGSSSVLRRRGHSQDDEDGSVLNGLAIACRHVILLMLICGLTGHNLYRMHWYFIPALLGVALHLPFYSDRPAASDDS